MHHPTHHRNRRLLKHMAQTHFFERANSPSAEGEIDRASAVNFVQSRILASLKHNDLISACNEIKRHKRSHKSASDNANLFLRCHRFIVRIDWSPFQFSYFGAEG